MVRRCYSRDFELIWNIINDSAQVYLGVIPSSCWHEPYMSRKELQSEIDSGVVFWGYEEAGTLKGVMGVQPVQNVTLIRHAYVLCRYQNRGIGAQLLEYLRCLAHGPVLIGTWAAASWAIRFYRKHGFQLVSSEVKEHLLRKYWTVSEQQIRNSVVLADESWQS